MRLWFEVNQHKEHSIRTFNEKGSEIEIIICQVISITARLIVPFNNFRYLHRLKNPKSQLLDNGLGVTSGSKLLLNFPASLIVAIRLRGAFFEPKISDTLPAIALGIWKAPDGLHRPLLWALFHWLWRKQLKGMFHIPWQISSNFSFLLVKEMLPQLF